MRWRSDENLLGICSAAWKQSSRSPTSCATPRAGASLLHVLIGFAEAFDVPPDEWVVLVDADWVDDHNFEFGSATVFTHRKHRREATADLGAACSEFQNVGCFF